MAALRESSPDPLTLSLNSSCAMRPPSSPSRIQPRLSRQHRVLCESSPSSTCAAPQQQHHEQQQTLLFNQPINACKHSSNSSPWKIRVPVEADPDETSVDNYRVSRTTTTKVPLKGEDEHGPTQPRASRAQKVTRTNFDRSESHTTPTSVGNPTPNKKRKVSSAAKDGSTGLNPHRTCGGNVHLPPSLVTPALISREAINQVQKEAPICQTEAAALTSLYERPEYAHLLWRPDSLDCTPFGQKRSAAIAATRRIRERVPTPRKPAGYNESLLSPIPWSSPTIEAAEPKPSLYPTSAIGDNGDADCSPDSESDDDNHHEIPGLAHAMEDDTLVLDRSLAENEDFSMVSIESLKSQQSTSEKELLLANHPTKQSRNSRFSLAGQTNVPLAQAFEHQNIPEGGVGDRGHEEEVQPEEKGIYKDGKTVVLPLSENPQIQDNQDLFGDSRLGKTQLPNGGPSSPHHSRNARLLTPEATVSDSGSRASPALKFGHEGPPLAPKTTAQPKIHSEEQNETWKYRPDASSCQINTPHAIHLESPQLTRSQKLERVWQAERDEVIRQALQVNASQIVYIDSDHGPQDVSQMSKAEQAEAETKTFCDIWQQEADRSLDECTPSRNVAANQTLDSASQDEMWHEVLGKDTRPLRSKLPRTWRRTSGSHFLYSNEAESPVQSCSARPVHPNTLPQQNKSSKQGCCASSKSNLHQSQHVDDDDMVYFSSESSTQFPPQSDESFTARNMQSTLVEDQPHNSTDHDNGSSQNPQVSHLKRLQDNLRAMATPRGRKLAGAPDIQAEGPRNEMLRLKLDCGKSYAPLFNDSFPSPPTKRQKMDPNYARHVKSAKSIVIAVAPTLQPPSHGIFGCLLSWLYPPLPEPEPRMTYAYDWNRNHYLLLNHFWNQCFEAPDYVHPIRLDAEAEKARWDALPASLRVLVSARVTRLHRKHPLKLTLAHCFVAAQLIAEARDSGIPWLCDGRRRAPRDSRRTSVDYNSEYESGANEDKDWPKRDASGRVSRDRQYWTPREVVKAVYGLWLIKTHDAAHRRGHRSNGKFTQG